MIAGSWNPGIPSDDGRRFTSLGGYDVRPRSHGFERPLDSWQLWGWGSIVVIFVLFFCLVGPVLPAHQASLAICGIMGVLGISVITLKIVLGLLPTEDPATHGPQLTRRVLENPRNIPYCRRWTDVTARHCAVCDKCSDGFDHHCRWLNVCVGRQNYRSFFAFVSLTLLSLLIVAASSVAATAMCLLETTRCSSRLRIMYGVASTEAYAVFTLLLFLYVLVGVAVVGHLWCYHVWLIATGRTTFSHIEEQRRRKREKREASRNEGAAGSTPQPPRGCCTEVKRRQFKAENQKPPGTAPFA
jgi:hypothetical protein